MAEEAHHIGVATIVWISLRTSEIVYDKMMRYVQADHFHGPVLVATQPCIDTGSVRLLSNTSTSIMYTTLYEQACMRCCGSRAAPR